MGSSDQRLPNSSGLRTPSFLHFLYLTHQLSPQNQAQRKIMQLSRLITAFLGLIGLAVAGTSFVLLATRHVLTVSSRTWLRLSLLQLREHAWCQQRLVLQWALLKRLPTWQHGAQLLESDLGVAVV